MADVKDMVFYKVCNSCLVEISKNNYWINTMVYNPSKELRINYKGQNQSFS